MEIKYQLNKYLVYIYIYIYNIHNRKVSGIKITHEFKMLPKVKEQVTNITI